MKTKISFLGIFVVVTLAVAAPHAWVLKTGETVTGDFVSSGTTTLVVKTGGTNCFLKISDLSTKDQVSVAKMHLAQIRSEAAVRIAQRDDIRYYSPVLGVETNASQIFTNVAASLKKGNGSPRAILTWEQELNELAQAGYVPAQLMIGRDMAGIDPSAFTKDQQLYWLKQAASNGSVEAKQQVGAEYLYGAGIAPQNLTEAAKYYQSLAATGDKDAKQKLSCLYAGNGDLQNLSEAIRLKEECGDYFGLVYLGLDKPGLMDRAEIYKWDLVGLQLGGGGYYGKPGSDIFANYSKQEFDEGERRANDYIKQHMK